MKRYRTPEAFRDALPAYLARRSRELRVSVELMRRRLVFHRFLARLLHVAPERWILSGGAALDWRLANINYQRARTTVDLDFMYRASQDEARGELEAAVRLDLNDYFSFTVNPGTRPAEQGGRSFRSHMTAYIGRWQYLTFLVDVGILDPLRWPPDQITVPDFFEDLGFGPMTVPTLPVPHQIAEKVHAITKLTKAGMPRTRVTKDLADLVMISTTERPAAHDVRTAIEAVFQAYDTHALPRAMPTTPMEWGRDYREAAIELQIPPDLRAADVMAGEFLNPVLQGTARGAWDPVHHRWSEEATDSTSR